MEKTEPDDLIKKTFNTPESTITLTVKILSGNGVPGSEKTLLNLLSTEQLSRSQQPVLSDLKSTNYLIFSFAQQKNIPAETIFRLTFTNAEQSKIIPKARMV